MRYRTITTIGQDSHRFEQEKTMRPLILGGIVIESDTPALSGNSDADVILHAITNAISGYTGVNVLGMAADQMCEKGIQDSSRYLQVALQDLPDAAQIVHVSLSVEGLRPKLKPYIQAIRARVAELLNISCQQVGLTATTGEGLTDFGRGAGIQVLCLLTIETLVFEDEGC